MTKKIFLFIVVLLWAIFALGCSSGWADVPIDAEHFPDERLRYFLAEFRREYNFFVGFGVGEYFDVNRNGVLEDDEIAKIEDISVGTFGLNLSGNIVGDVHNLQGIKYLTSLRTLSLGSCKITSLDVSDLTSLESITITRYTKDINRGIGVWLPLKELNVTGCTSLKTLNCSSNDLTELDLRGLTSLESVNCNHNKLRKILTSGCTSLQGISCGDNQISSLNLSGLPALLSLSCNNNDLTDLSGLNNLEHLECAKNKIKMLNLSNCRNLKFLACSNNEITSLNLSGFKDLYTVDCSNNKLSNLELDGCKSLRSLYCENNNIAYLNLGDSTLLSDSYGRSLDIGQTIEISRNEITRTGSDEYPYQFDFKKIVSSKNLENFERIFFSLGEDFSVNDILHGYLKNGTFIYGAIINTIYDTNTGIVSFKENPNLIRYSYNTNNPNCTLGVTIKVVSPSSSKKDPEITTTSLPDGKIGEPYSKTLEATGTTPFNWSTYDELPDGLTLNSDGKISGTPNESGTFLISVEVSNDVGTDIKAFELLIKANSEDKIEPPIITTNTLPDGVVSEDYMKTLDAYGTTPIIWSVIKNNLPDGLILSSGGEISGTPLKQGIYNFTVQASNDAGINTKDLKIIINLPEIISSDPEPEPTPVITIVKPEITTSSIPSGKVNTAYSPFQLTATGTTPITWEAIDLPSGITCSKSGVLSGTPTRAGNFANVVIIASNSAGSTLKSFIFRIEEATATVTRPSITTQNNLPSATVNEFYRQQFSASGTTPITWSASGLPKGLNFNSSGLMSGIPETSGKFNFSVSAKNSAGTDTKTFSITINAASTPTPTPEPDPTPEPINNDDFDEEFANNMREFLGKENSTPVKNLSSENASINNNVEAPIYWDDENNGEIIALLPEIIVDTDGIYLLRVSFDETVEAGSNLKWYSFAQNANSASAKISEIEGEDYAFLDDDGNQIISPTINALDYMNVAVFFEANKKYSPVISAISKKNNNSNNNANNNNNNTVTSSGGGGGGCNFNFGILSAILALTFLIRNVKTKQQ